MSSPALPSGAKPLIDDRPTEIPDAYLKFTVKEILADISAKLDRLNARFDTEMSGLSARLRILEEQEPLRQHIFQEFYKLQSDHFNLRDVVHTHTTLGMHMGTAEQIRDIDKRVIDLQTYRVGDEQVQAHTRWLVGVSLASAVNLGLFLIQMVLHGLPKP